MLEEQWHKRIDFNRCSFMTQHYQYDVNICSFYCAKTMAHGYCRYSRVEWRPVYVLPLNIDWIANANRKCHGNEIDGRSGGLICCHNTGECKESESGWDRVDRLRKNDCSRRKEEWWRESMDWKEQIVSWETEGRYHFSKMFPWEPEGRYRHRLCTAIAPFWFSMEHLSILIAPFWLSTDEMHSVKEKNNWGSKASEMINL